MHQTPDRVPMPANVAPPLTRPSREKLFEHAMTLVHRLGPPGTQHQNNLTARAIADRLDGCWDYHITIEG